MIIQLVFDPMLLAVGGVAAQQREKKREQGCGAPVQGCGDQ
jgi:hypothetical protein